MPRHKPTVDPAAELQGLLRLWMLRILVPLGGYRNFIGRHCFQSDVVAGALGLSDELEEGADFSQRAALGALRKLHRRVEREARGLSVPAALAHNIARLSKLVGLSACECRIVEFAVLIHSERALDDAADCLGALSISRCQYALSVLLGISEAAVRAALSAQGILARSGLVCVTRSGNVALKGKLDLLSESFADVILTPGADPISLLRGTINPSSGPDLTLADYRHLQPTLDVLLPYFRRSLDARRRGVNVYLHGASGTGKTQFAKVLAGALGCELFEVAGEDRDGDPIDGEHRLRALRAAQSFLGSRRSLILFDEVEDVFNDGHTLFGRKSTAQTHKAWINRVLEDNAVPTLWVSNTAQGIDAAFLRRFDLVFELPVPPRQQRQRILAQTCAGLLEPEQIARLAGSDVLAPAVATRAASVLREIRADLKAEQIPHAFELIVGNTLKAQGHPTLRRGEDELPGLYDPAFVNADADLSSLTDGLVRERSGRLCLYGPPGTGKSAFGRWVAEQLQAPLVVKRASDLLSMWVGGNERNIAQAFREAEDEGGVLLIDEMDSFLPDRRGAQRSWEVTLVNEMLTQMEAFSGVFIASTNLVDHFDPAALRRFDVKLKFDFLRSDQALRLLERYARELGLPAPQAAETATIGRLRVLTPGDFAAVARQSRLRPPPSCAALVAALEAECALKAGPKRAVGFCP